ncbi:MAG: hypothetical protein J0I70_03550 [Microbacterium sp.]|nr:hypothetical protein [Microbacterium sp.]MBN9172074.1 hypothetical protein [Microbacterium sp.]MBN9173213.1 hypothetical protein [Microbacterium sp.]
MAGSSHGAIGVLRILSALVLIVTGGIHVFLVFDGVGGTLGVLFILNGVAAVVLAVGVLITRGRLLAVTAVLGLLFLVATLLSLVLALTVGLFGIRETWDFTLVPETVVVESIGIVLLAAFAPLVLRGRRSDVARA